MCLQIVGAVVSGIGAFMQAKQQAASYEAQAKIHERQSNLERAKGAYEATRMTDRGKQLLGKQIAAYGSAGIAVSGTIAETVRKTGEELALDVAAARYGTKINVENERILASVNRMNASAANASAPFALLSPIIGAAGSMFSGGFGGGTYLSSAYSSPMISSSNVGGPVPAMGYKYTAPNAFAHR